jgi:hypothetical protein
MPLLLLLSSNHRTALSAVCPVPTRTRSAEQNTANPNIDLDGFQRREGTRIRAFLTAEVYSVKKKKKKHV